MTKTNVPAALLNFLACPTPEAWVNAATHHLDLLLIDHAHCEKKAAASALGLIHHYPQHPQLLQKMSRLAREELRHFEQVLTLLKKRNIAFCALHPSPYAQRLKQYVRKTEPERLQDTLIIGAFIEARSCERFASLIPVLDDELANFYTRLLNSESRHFSDYLQLAQQLTDVVQVETRVAFFAKKEAELIQGNAEIFRFHSGIPVDNPQMSCSKASTYAQSEA